MSDSPAWATAIAGLRKDVPKLLHDYADLLETLGQVLSVDATTRIHRGFTIETIRQHARELPALLASLPSSATTPKGVMPSDCEMPMPSDGRTARMPGSSSESATDGAVVNAAAAPSRIADAILEYGRKASSGEPLFFDRFNLERVIREALAMPPPQKPPARDFSKVTRLEVIGEGGRLFTEIRLASVQPSFQDQGRTLKLFIERASALAAVPPPTQQPEKCRRCGKLRGEHRQGPRGLECYIGEDLCWLPPPTQEKP